MPNNLTRKDIANLIGKSPQYIGVQINRGHLIEKNKRIDTDNAKNKAFLNKFITKEVEKESQEEIEPDNTQTANDSSLKVNQGNIDYKLKKQELELKTVKTAKERLDLDKKKGKLIEIKAATDVMQRSVVVLSSQYRQNSKQFITELAAKYNIPDSDLAGIQKWFDNTINKAVAESTGLIKKECEIIASEYSESLNIGESKS
jgi:LysM repeat protein